MPGIKGIIQLETGCFPNLTPPQVAMLAKVPMLVMVGDHWDSPQPPTDCKTEMQQINAAGGDMTFVYLPDAGQHGNSHMFMQDKNNLQVADILLDWTAQRLRRRAFGRAQCNAGTRRRSSFACVGAIVQSPLRQTIK
jgi:hypothetical protein